MKKLFTQLFALVIIGTAFTSCMKNDNNYDDTDYLEQLKKERLRVDSTLKAQKPLLEKYAMEEFKTPVYDDSTGIWFEILSPATDESYEYKINSSGSWVTPTATLKYKGQLLTKVVFDEPSQPVEMQIVERSQYQPGLINAWPIAFRPKTINFGGKEYHTGLIPKGLKKGHKIRFIAPSPYCYDNKASSDGKIPKDSPLDFTIEVVDIK